MSDIGLPVRIVSPEVQQAIDALDAAEAAEDAEQTEIAALMDRAKEMSVSPPITPTAPPKKGKPDPGTTFNVKCPECDVVMLGSSLRSHRQVKHGYGNGIDYSEAALRQWETNAPRTRKARGPAKKHAPKKTDTPVSTGDGHIGKRTSRLDSDAFIETILVSLFPKNIPPSKYKAVSKWVAATEAFMEEAEL